MALWNVWSCLLGLVQDFLDHKLLIRYFDNHHFGLSRACTQPRIPGTVGPGLTGPAPFDQNTVLATAWVRCATGGALVASCSKSKKHPVKLMSIIHAVLFWTQNISLEPLRDFTLFFILKSSKHEAMVTRKTTPVLTSPVSRTQQPRTASGRQWTAQQWTGEAWESHAQPASLRENPLVPGAGDGEAQGSRESGKHLDAVILKKWFWRKKMGNFGEILLIGGKSSWEKKYMRI